MSTPTLHLQWAELLHEYGLHIPTRTIHFDYGVEESETGLDEALARRTVNNLLLLNNLSQEPIQLLINCEGGSVTHGFAVYDAIRQSPSEVHGVVQGHCDSMAVWVLQACHNRAATRHSELMIHNGVGDKTEWDKRQDKVTEDILLRRVRQANPRFQRAHLRRLLEKDTYMSATEALKLGLIDEVIG